MLSVDRRALLAGTAASLAAGAARAADPPRTRLILLGTRGGPRVDGPRANPANLLIVGGVPYLIDCGYGVTRQWLASKVPLLSMRNIFISHLHSDHVLEYGNLFYNAWAMGFAGRVDSYGPPGIAEMTKDFFALNHVDIDTRMEDEGRKDPRQMLIPHEITANGPVMADERVRVTAFQTPHPPMTDLAYKFETPDGVVVLSGDTEYNPALADFAKGADVLVHEVIHEPSVDKLVAAVPNAASLKKHLLASHTTTDDVGRIAKQAGVKLLVLSHFVAGNPPPTDDMWLEGVRRHFDGKVIVGRDLMEIALPV